MKNKILFSLLTLAACLGSIQAQTIDTNAPTNPVQFAAQAGNWLTTVDTNKNWDATRFNLWACDAYQSGLNTSVELGASYDLWKPSANTALAPEVAFNNAGIAGTILSGQGGVSFSYAYFDLKFSFYVDGGYSPALSTGLVEIGGRIQKKMTISTYALLGLSQDFYFKSALDQKVPTIKGGLGWCF